VETLGNLATALSLIKKPNMQLEDHKTFYFFELLYWFARKEYDSCLICVSDILRCSKAELLQECLPWDLILAYQIYVFTNKNPNFEKENISIIMNDNKIMKFANSILIDASLKDHFEFLIKDYVANLTALT
jgi:hypothetical protein